jgi:hypothetical protein
MLAWRRGSGSGVSSRKARSRPVFGIERIEAPEDASWAGADLQAAPAGGVDAGGPVALHQREHAEAGA